MEGRILVTFRRLVFKHDSPDDRTLLRLASIGGWVARKLCSPFGGQRALVNRATELFQRGSDRPARLLTSQNHHRRTSRVEMFTHVP